MTAAALLRACPQRNGCPLVSPRDLRRLDLAPRLKNLVVAAGASVLLHLGAMAALAPRETALIAGGGEDAPAALGTSFADFAEGVLAPSEAEPVEPETTEAVPAAPPSTSTGTACTTAAGYTPLCPADAATDRTSAATRDGRTGFAHGTRSQCHPAARDPRIPRGQHAARTAARFVAPCAECYAARRSDPTARSSHHTPARDAHGIAPRNSKCGDSAFRTERRAAGSGPAPTTGKGCDPSCRDGGSGAA